MLNILMICGPNKPQDINHIKNSTQVSLFQALNNLLVVVNENRGPGTGYTKVYYNM